MRTLGFFMLCFAIGHLLLPILSRVFPNRLAYRLTPLGSAADASLVIAGTLLIVLA